MGRTTYTYMFNIIGEQEGKPDTGRLDAIHNDVCLCGSAHDSGCVVNAMSAMAAY